MRIDKFPMSTEGATVWDTLRDPDHITHSGKAVLDFTHAINMPSSAQDSAVMARS